MGVRLHPRGRYHLILMFGCSWRLTLGLGSVFPLAVLFFRMQMREPASYAKNSMKHIPFFQLPWRVVMKHYWHRLFGISLAWLLYDWIAYPGSIYSSVIVARVIPNGTFSQVLGWSTLYVLMARTSNPNQMTEALCLRSINFFYIPGTICGALTIDKLGPKWTMITGLCLFLLFRKAS